VLDVDYVVGAYVGVLAETVLRMTEGLFSMGLVNLNQRMLTVNYKAQHIPLSDYAIELLRSLPRMIGCPYVFVRLRATQWVKHRIDLRTVQELLGHRDISTTMRYERMLSAPSPKRRRKRRKKQLLSTQTALRPRAKNRQTKIL